MTRVLILAVTAVVALAGAGGTSNANTLGAVLPRSVILPQSVVNQLFPEVTRVASTGRNSTATGSPKATRSVIYANATGSKKVTISVDQYGSSSDALAAYQQAVQKSKIPGMKPLPVPKVGRQAFAGTVTMNGETHIGLGALDGRLVVGATLAGYDATADNVAKLVSLARKEDAAAKAALRVEGG